MDKIVLRAHLNYEVHDPGLHHEEQHILWLGPSLRQIKIGHKLAVVPRDVTGITTRQPQNVGSLTDHRFQAINVVAERFAIVEAPHMILFRM